MAKKEFHIDSYEKYDKFIIVNGPDDLRLEVDYDDVDHKSTEENMKKMVDILNDNWNNPKYSKHADDLYLLALEKWFVKTFEEVASDESNSESIDSIEVKRKANSIEIEFAVDGDDYGVHRGNIVTISDKGIHTKESEFLESRSISTEVEKRLKTYIELNPWKPQSK